MTNEAKVLLRQVIREALDDEAGLSPATGPAAEQEVEIDDARSSAATPPAKNLEPVIVDVLMSSDTLQGAIDRFVRAVKNVVKREVVSTVAGLDRRQVEAALTEESDFSMTLTHGIVFEIARSLVEELQQPST